MRIVEHYPLGLRLFLGKGLYALFYPVRIFLAVLYGIYLDIIAGKKDSSSKKFSKHASESGISYQVISIGNLEAGGSGKTPVTLAIASHLMGRGKKVAVVTRGFGSAAEKNGFPVAVVPAGDPIHEYSGRWILASELEMQLDCRGKMASEIEVTGDEAHIYLSRMIPVVIDPNRSRGIEAAGHLFRPDYILLDDAYRHTEIAVDLNILLLDAKKPFGNHRLIPAGTLRERPKAADRADLIIFTRSDDNSIPSDALELIKGKRLLFASHKVVGLVDSAGNVVSLESIEPGEVILFSGIARPESFEASIIEAGITPRVSMRFEDHHEYSQDDVNRVKSVSAENHVYITTEKDICKVERLFDSDDLLLALRIEAEIAGIEVIGEA